MGNITIQIETGRLYSLENILHLTSKFKSKTHLTSKDGIYQLYVNQSDESYWIGGPFLGKDSNFFMFMGCPRSKSELNTLIASLHPDKKQETEYPLVNQWNNDLLRDDGFYFPLNEYGGFFSFLDHISSHHDWDFSNSDWGDLW